MLPDTEPLDIDALRTLVTRLKVAPPQDIPKESLEKIAKWGVPPSSKDVRTVISAGGCSPPAKRLLNAVFDMVQNLP